MQGNSQRSEPLHHKKGMRQSISDQENSNEMVLRHCRGMLSQRKQRSCKHAVKNSVLAGSKAIFVKTSPTLLSDDAVTAGHCLLSIARATSLPTL